MECFEDGSRSDGRPHQGILLKSSMRDLEEGTRVSETILVEQLLSNASIAEDQVSMIDGGGDASRQHVLQSCC